MSDKTTTNAPPPKPRRRHSLEHRLDSLPYAGEVIRRRGEKFVRLSDILPVLERAYRMGRRDEKEKNQ